MNLQKSIEEVAVRLGWSVYIVRGLIMLGWIYHETVLGGFWEHPDCDDALEQFKTDVYDIHFRRYER